MKPEDSLDIISKIISDTRRGVLQQSYVPFITWGGSTVAVSLLVFFTIRHTDNFWYNLLWFLIPVFGMSLTMTFQPKQEMPPTGIVTSLRSIWNMLTIILVSFSVSSFFIRFNVLFYILLLLSIGSFVSGAVISYRFLKYSSVAGFISSAALLLISGINQIPVFAAAMAVMMVVPGIKMKQDLARL